MNPYSGIGMAYQTHETPSFTQQNRYDEDEMQPNTANPFKKTIIDIIQTRNVPSQSMERYKLHFTQQDNV